MSLRFTAEQLAETMRHLERQRIPKISPEERAKRAPPPPEQLVGALQDRIHDSGQVRVAKSVRKPNDAAIPASAKIAITPEQEQALQALADEHQALGMYDDDLLDARASGREQSAAPSRPARVAGGYRSKLEARYAEQLEIRKRALPVYDSPYLSQWLYEPLTFRLPGGIRYTPDFLLVWELRERHSVEPLTFFEFHECKGYMREPARLRLRAAVECYPMFDWYIVGADLQPRLLRTAADVPKGGRWT